MLPKSTLELIERVKTDFVGLDTSYTLADGRTTRRIYLDSTASTLMMGAAQRAMLKFLGHYANTHSLQHFPAKVATREYAWAHERILSFLGADPDTHACFFAGAGATTGINRLARTFHHYRPDHPVVLVSLMEHHSNDLPHRRHAEQVIHVPLEEWPDGPGRICKQELETHLKAYPGKVNYIGVTAVSNVTGIINPVPKAAALAHQYGALILVDGAQAVAHVPVRISGNSDPAEDIDALVFSGHKTYVPGSPGVVICRKDILQAQEPVEVGGGMVDRVFVDRYIASDKFPDREEAGTPNIVGAVGLAAAIEVLDGIGMEAILEHETELILYAMQRLYETGGVKVYGSADTEQCPRAASISFNIVGMDHGLVAAILNDFYNISVRNECFCAHPYVKEMVFDDLLEAVDGIDEEDLEAAMMLKAGMVRASFGLYNDESDVDALVAALGEIVARQGEYAGQYAPDAAGNYTHKTFRPLAREQFSAREYIREYLEGVEATAD